MNTQTTLTETPAAPIFDIKTAAEWLEEARTQPMPRPLFGDLWLEDEISILFADAGLGKSILAVQIAESIASGTAVGQFENKTMPQGVLYLDMALSEKQFEMRYAEESDDEDNEELENHYPFSANFHRVQIDPCSPVPKGFSSFQDFIYEGVTAAAGQLDARVLIVDSITQLKRSNDIVRDMLPMMRLLHRLKHELGLSILVLAQTPKRTVSRPLNVNDMHGAKLLSNFADNIFAIGQSKAGRNLRYIKHIKPQSTELFYSAAHVPTFRIEKIDGNFLGFVFESFAAEGFHLRDSGDSREWATIDKIKAMSDKEMSVREIADQLGMARTTVHRLLQMWMPPPAQPHKEPVVSPYDFPGRDKYDAAMEHPRYNEVYEHDTPEGRALAREFCILDNARGNARKEYLKTGHAPTVAEMLEKMGETDPVAAALAVAVAEDAASPLDVRKASGFPSVSNECIAATPPSEAKPPKTLATVTGEAQLLRTSSGTADSDDGHSIDLSRLKRAANDYGTEIFIEKEDERGKPMVWYEYDSQNQLRRRQRKGFGIIGTIVDDPPNDGQ